jgi:hypothetical protein
MDGGPRLKMERSKVASRRNRSLVELETDYLVVGAGATGMAFVDTLLQHSRHNVILVDRRHAPGGHWLDAYPFVRLHQPSAIYGVESMPLGMDRIDSGGPNAGYYERASAAEICAYYERVLQDRMLATGRVRFLPLHDHHCPEDDAELAVSRLTGRPCRIRVRRAVVDARYLEAGIPARRPPPFDVAPGMQVIPPNALPGVTQAQSGFTVIGAGKSAMDTVVWLLDQGVLPEYIRWIRARDAWLSDRSCLQALDLSVPTLACGARSTEAAAQARDMDDLFRRLQEVGLFSALDPEVTPGTFRGAQTSKAERDTMRRVTRVVRAGYVTAITPERIEMQEGSIPTDPEHLHIDCTANALTPRPTRPVFEDGRITIQCLRFGLTCFNAALTAYVEATRAELAEKNRLCPPCVLPSDASDWVTVRLHSMLAEEAWNKEPDITSFMLASRVNILRATEARRDDPQLKAAMATMAQYRLPAIENLQRLNAATEAKGRGEELPTNPLRKQGAPPMGGHRCQQGDRQ